MSNMSGIYRPKSAERIQAERLLEGDNNQRHPDDYSLARTNLLLKALVNVCISIDQSLMHLTKIEVDDDNR